MERIEVYRFKDEQGYEHIGRLPVEENRIEIQNNTLIIVKKELEKNLIVSGVNYTPLLVLAGIVILGVVVGLIITRKIYK